MKSDYEFIKLYEELSSLNEAKQDTLNFKNWLISNGASESEADGYTKRFDAIKSRLKSPENDYYYWIKQMKPNDVYDVINDTERVVQIKKYRRQEIADGAELVHESEHWKIYHITNFDASQYYGRDSKWCVTGVGSYGDRYWKDYIRKGYVFYFCIAKQNYNPRGDDSKFALAIHPEAECFQVFNQQDSEVNLEDIPEYTEIQIPGVDFNNYINTEPKFCEHCEAYIVDGDECWGKDGEIYCEDCWSDYYFYCASCGDMYSQDAVYAGLDGDDYCYDCWAERFYECPRCYDIVWLDDVHYDENGEGYCSDCWDEIQEEDDILDEFEADDEE